VPEEAVSTWKAPNGQAPPRESIFRNWEITSRLVPEPGVSRHKHLVNLAVALNRDAKVGIDEAMWLVAEVNRGFEQPKDLGEVQRIVRWAYGVE
jgi:hypothetical protein